MPPGSPDIQTVLADPNFQSLGIADKHKVMAKVDPNYAGLPQREQMKVLDRVQYGAPSTPPATEGFWKTAAGDLYSAAKSSIGIGTNPVSDYAAAKGFVENLKDIPQHWQEQKAAGRSLPYRANAAVGQATGLPVRATEEAAERGDPGAVLGHAVLPTALALSPIATEGAGRIGEALDERAIPGRITEGKTGLLRVLKPKPGAGGAAGDAMERNVHAAVDSGDLPKIFRDTPLQGKGAAIIGDAIDKIDAYQDDLWEKGHEAPVGRHAQMPFDSGPVAQRALSVIDDAASRTSTPAQVRQAQGWVQNAFRPNLTLGTADDMIRSLNAEIKDPPDAWGPIGARVRMEALKGLREGVDQHLADAGEEGVGDVNRRWGALQGVKERLGERYWSEWQKQAAKEANPVPSWMRAYAFAHPGGVATVVGARLTGSMFAPSDTETFASSAKKLARTGLEPKAITTPAYVNRPVRGLLPAPPKITPTPDYGEGPTSKPQPVEPTTRAMRKGLLLEAPKKTLTTPTPDYTTPPHGTEPTTSPEAAGDTRAMRKGLLLGGKEQKALPPAPTSKGATITPEPPPQSSPKLPTSPAVEGQIHDQLAAGKMSVGEVFRMVRRGTLDQQAANRILKRLRSNVKAPTPPRS